MHYSRLGIFLLISSLLGCAQPFDRPDEISTDNQSPSASQIYADTLSAHRGKSAGPLTDISVGLTGEWPFLITRIQPLVSDYKFRVDSQERLLPGEGVYAALYHGPAGSKKVVRKNDQIRVFYNGEESFDEDVLRSSALTADAFFLFLLGPLALENRSLQFVRLPDAREKGRDYFRLYTEMKPGFGFAEKDELILWIDKTTNLTYRINITLEGYKSTKGAHVDVSYLGYTEKSGYILPDVFRERVLGPVRIRAHDWQLTGMDINRGTVFADLDGNGWSALAAPDAGLEKP